MENKHTNANANTEANNAAEKNESSRKSFGGKLARILVETPMSVQYANSVIKTVSEVAEERCKEEVGRAVPAYLRVDFVCEAVSTLFKDPDSPMNKDKFLRGVVAFMLAHQMQHDIEEQTGESNKKEETDNGLR